MFPCLESFGGLNTSIETTLNVQSAQLGWTGAFDNCGETESSLSAAVERLQKELVN